MIPVGPRPEPRDFHERVGRRGADFLRTTPRPTSASWKGRQYWRNVLPDLREAYRGICAYSAVWIPQDVGTATVDHFVPKSVCPDLAYKWENYRLSSLLMNSRKGNHRDVVDPFDVRHEWSVLRFPSMLVHPGPDLSEEQKERVEQTIRRLKLNSHDQLVQSRLKWVLDFCHDGITFEHLESNAPFIAYELERQGLRLSIASIMAAC